LCGAIVLKLIR